MIKYEIRKVWEDGTSQIMYQELSEGDSAHLAYSMNRNLPITSKFYYEVVPQERNVPLALRLRN